MQVTTQILLLEILPQKDLMKLCVLCGADLVLTDKLVTYDLEKKTIGWTEYNCKDPPFVDALLLFTAM